MTPLLVPMHGIGSRRDLPLPFEYVLLGAALVLCISFLVLIFAWRRPRWDGGPRGLALPRLTRVVDAPAFRLTARLLALAVWLLAGIALWFGQDRVTNPYLGFLFVWLWVGVVPFSLVLGPAWRALNPLRTIYSALAAVPGLRGRVGTTPLPASVGILPATAGLAAFTFLELVQPGNNTLPVLRVWAVIWFVGLLAGALRWGEDWIAAADPFEAYGSLVARVSPWRRIDGRICLVNPLANLVAGPHVAGTAAAVSVLLGSTAFDSFGATTGWIRLVQNSGIPAAVWGTGGLAVMIGLVAATFRLGVLGMLPQLAPRPQDAATKRQVLSDVMAASVIPIVIGYALGHYLSLLVLEGQRTAILFSDPLGLGWNLFGTAELGIWSAWLDYPQVIAVLQLAFIVGGHLLGVLVAHELAIARLRPRGAVSGQLPLLVVMICYTLGGLVLLFSP